MGFIAYKTGDGHVAPIEYLPAEAGIYDIGMALAYNTDSHQLAASTTPKYICVGSKEIKTAGAELPCIKIADGMVFETALSAAGAVYPGSAYWVTADGKKVAPTGTEGQNKFVVEYAAGAAAGDLVRGHFVS